MLKAYKYRLYPTKEQETFLQQSFGCSRFIYNWGLAKKIEAYNKDKHTISCFNLINEMAKLKQTEEHKWLNDVYSQSLQMPLRNLDNAFTSFFKKNSDFPKFKAKHHSRKSVQFPQGIKVNFDDNTIFVPKAKEIDCIFHRTFKGIIKTTTVSQNSSGKYFVSILVDDGKDLPIKKKIELSKTIGVDLGIKHFAILSTGEKIDNPKYFEKQSNKIKQQQRQLSKKLKGGKRREKARIKLAKTFENITNQRDDFLHKLSHKLVCENQTTTLCFEDLNIAVMVKNHCLAGAIGSASWSKFLQFVKYKCEWNGVNFIQIGRWDASSKTCTCGHKNENLTLKQREWTCEKCGATHDRDILAANNIKQFALIKTRREGTLSESKQSAGSDVA
jgi:putative transposase